MKDRLMNRQNSQNYCVIVFFYIQWFLYAKKNSIRNYNAAHLILLQNLNRSVHIFFIVIRLLPVKVLRIFPFNILYLYKRVLCFFSLLEINFEIVGSSRSIKIDIDWTIRFKKDAILNILSRYELWFEFIRFNERKRRGTHGEKECKK